VDGVEQGAGGCEMNSRQFANYFGLSINELKALPDVGVDGALQALAENKGPVHGVVWNEPEHKCGHLITGIQCQDNTILVGDDSKWKHCAVPPTPKKPARAPIKKANLHRKRKRKCRTQAIVTQYILHFDKKLDASITDKNWEDASRYMNYLTVLHELSGDLI
jgi:hypothetical protein